MESFYGKLLRCLEKEILFALATVISGQALGKKMLIQPNGCTEGSLESLQLNQEVRKSALGLLKRQISEKYSCEINGERTEVFIEVFSPSPKLIIIGAVHLSISLITFAKALGFKTIVIDPRSVFATPERFRHADEVIIEWPHEVLSASDFDEGTYLVALSHDAKLDNPALKLALESPCRYVGALGSLKTHARRIGALEEMGVSKEQISRIHAPVGLNLGGRRPEDIALSIIAQIVAVKHGRSEK